jgi:NADH-quinone oxidoreductase subunit G
VGAQLVKAVPGAGGLNAGQMLGQPMKALLLLDVEPPHDAADAAAAQAALAGSGLVVALTSFRDAAVPNADVLLPIAPFTETAGTFVNAEGRAQSFSGVVPPPAMPARPGRCCACSATCWAWPASTRRRPTRCVPRRWATWPSWPRAWTTAPRPRITVAAAADGLQRLADVPIYATDALVRRCAVAATDSRCQAGAAGQPAVGAVAATGPGRG